MYVFDTSSLREMKHFYPGIFKSIWTDMDALVAAGEIISTREVEREIQDQNASVHVQTWCSDNKPIFTTPTSAETAFVARILAIPHFQALIGQKQLLAGKPVADPFVIACAHIRMATVVTEERFKANAAKIPNVCRHFNIPCISLEEFMAQQGWTF